MLSSKAITSCNERLMAPALAKLNRQSRGCGISVIDYMYIYSKDEVCHGCGSLDNFKMTF